jgi:ankyrin repeat protein
VDGSQDGCTALHLAARNGDPDTVRTLLDCGAEVAAATKVGDPQDDRSKAPPLACVPPDHPRSLQDGWTPLHITAAAGNTNAASLMLRHGARLDTIIKASTYTL